MTAVLVSDDCPTGCPDGAGWLDPEVLQAQAIFDAARVRLLAAMSADRDAIDLAEAQRLLDALSTARLLAEDAEDRVLRQRHLPGAAEGAGPGRRAVTRPESAPRPPAPDLTRDAASVLLRAVLPVAAALVGAAVGHRLRPH